MNQFHAVCRIGPFQVCSCKVSEGYLKHLKILCSTIFNTKVWYAILLLGKNGILSYFYQDVDCDFIDITYVCCSSYYLDSVLKKEISKFSDSLRRDNQGWGQISLEFFQKKKSHWPFQPENISWEVWNVHIELLKLCNENDRLLQKEAVGEKIGEKIIHIAEIMNRHEYLPSIPPQSELELIFDTSFPDVQPYLFKLVYTTPDTASPSVGSTIRKFIQGSLSLWKGPQDSITGMYHVRILCRYCRVIAIKF